MKRETSNIQPPTPNIEGRQRGAKIWSALEALAEAAPPSAVLAEWRRLGGADFGTLETFLSPTSRVAGDYPCLAEVSCGCRHELVSLDDDRWLARCECEMSGCRAAALTTGDVLIHEIDALRLSGTVGGALGFEATPAARPITTAAKVWPAGMHAETQSPVFLFLCPNQEQMLANLTGLAGNLGEPFIVLAPTAQVRSELVGSFLQRERCTFIPLTTCLAPHGAGFRVTKPIRPVLDRFAEGLRGNSESRKQKAEIEHVAPRYSIRKGFRTWELVFRGLPAPIDDGRAVRIAAYLLRNPPVERIHAIKLERLVWAQSYVDEKAVNRSQEEEADLAANLSVRSEVGGVTRCEDDNVILKREVRELLETIRDGTLPKAERDEAQARLDEISRALSGRGEVSSEPAKAAMRVRKTITRLYEQLAVATDEANRPHPVLREFAEHLRKYLIVPSARFTRSKNSRNRAGVAGTFTYEPPAGVVWED